MGVVSHDLRNPLGNIITLASYIEKESENTLTEDQRQYLQIIMKSGRQMLDMLNNLLDVTKIETGNLGISLVQVDIAELIKQTVSEYHHTAIKKNISIEYSFADNLPMVQVDPEHIDRALSNLMSNAIKYSYPNTLIEIMAEIRGEYLVISVKDQGQGIPDNEQFLLFMAFSKTSIHSTAGEKSTGLGLNITKKVIEAHGGQIWVESKLGEGSTFSFSIPLVPQAIISTN
jgi:signal transduction histidine kinase